MTRQITPDTLPDFHFMLLAPNLGPDWLFDVSRAYWTRFRPTVIYDVDLIALVPEQLTIAVTILTRRDAFRPLAVQIASARPDALLDTVVADSLEEASLTLDTRARLNQPFGVPLTPTEPPPTLPPIQPSPGAVVGGPTSQPTANPNGFITQTPNTSGFITQTPTPTSDRVAPSGPIQSTPGPITGE